MSAERFTVLVGCWERSTSTQSASHASLKSPIGPLIGVDHPYQLYQRSQHLYKRPAEPQNQPSYHCQDGPDTDRIFFPPRCTHVDCTHTIPLASIASRPRTTQV